MEKFDGYEEARKIDDKINALLKKYPINNYESRMQWRRFARTLETTMRIIKEVSNNPSG